MYEEPRTGSVIDPSQKPTSSWGVHTRTFQGLIHGGTILEVPVSVERDNTYDLLEEV